MLAVVCVLLISGEGGGGEKRVCVGWQIGSIYLWLLDGWYRYGLSLSRRS